MVCVPHLLHTRSYIAFPLLQTSHLCVFCDILSPKAVYRVLCPFFRPKMLSPGDREWYHSRTFGAHVLATVVGPSPNGPQLCHMQYIRPGGVTEVDHESAPTLKARGCGGCITQSLHLCSVCLHQWRIPQFALKYPCNLPPSPPPGGDRSRATGGDFKGFGLWAVLPAPMRALRAHGLLLRGSQVQAHHTHPTAKRLLGGAHASECGRVSAVQCLCARVPQKLRSQCGGCLAV